MFKQLLLKPILSEKAYGLSEERNTYVFDVPEGINRHNIALAVANQYDVGVIGVRMAAMPAKPRRSYSRGSRKFYSHQKAGGRKAYVTLKEGDNLPFFNEISSDKESK